MARKIKFPKFPKMEFWRLNLILVLFFLCGLAVIGQLFFLQIIRGDYYRALARGLYSINEEITDKRGELFFKNEEPLAVNYDWPLVFSSPTEIQDKQKTAEILAEILAANKNSILEKFQEDGPYVVIKKRLTDS